MPLLTAARFVAGLMIFVARFIVRTFIIFRVLGSRLFCARLLLARLLTLAGLISLLAACAAIGLIARLVLIATRRIARLSGIA